MSPTPAPVVVSLTNARYSLCQAILFLILGRSQTFIFILGMVALGVESTLPIPQMIRYVAVFCIASSTHCVPVENLPSNHKQRSLYGFRLSTLLGWVGGDAFKWVQPHGSLPIWRLNLSTGRCTSLYRIRPYSSKYARYSSYRSTSVSAGPYISAPSLIIVKPVIVGQRLYFGNAMPASTMLGEDDIEQALVLAEE